MSDSNYDDMLMMMWREQAEHWRSEWIRYGEPSDVNDMHLRLCHHLHGEVDELLRCADWKIHAEGEMAPKRNILFECVDLWKFLMTMMMLHDVTPFEFMHAFREKSLVVRGRVKLEVLRKHVALHPDRPLLISDIDGVLCDRDIELLAFANGRVDRGTFRSVSDYRETHGQKEYEKLKASFYDSGGFARVDPIEANVAALKAHYKVYPHIPVLLVTSRDVVRYPHLEAETYHWLAKHEIPFAGLVFASEKERAITWVPKCSVAIDDEAEHVKKLSLVCDAYQYSPPAIPFHKALDRVVYNAPE